MEEEYRVTFDTPMLIYRVYGVAFKMSPLGAGLRSGGRAGVQEKRF